MIPAEAVEVAAREQLARTHSPSLQRRGINQLQEALGDYRDSSKEESS